MLAVMGMRRARSSTQRMRRNEGYSPKPSRLAWLVPNLETIPAGDDPLRCLLAFLLLASLAALGFALTAQYGFELHPCHLCLYQRVPYVCVAVLALAALWFDRKAAYRRIALALASAFLMAGAGIAAYHAGVEAGMFAGPGGCVNTATAGASLEQLRAQIMGAPLVACDQPMARFLDVSMAGWNAMASAGLALLGWAALWRTRGRHV